MNDESPLPESMDIVDEICETIEQFDVPLEMIISALSYVLADALAQMSDGVPNKQVVFEAQKVLLGCYFFHCTPEEGANITIQ